MYNAKSNDSFNARLRFYLFYCALQGGEKQIDKSEFMRFDIDENPALEYVNLYVTEYQQFNRKHTISKDKNKRDNDEIYAALKKLEKENKPEISGWKDDYRKYIFSAKLNEEQFNTFKDEKKCGYCKITIDEINELASTKKLFKKNERGFNLELDRKSPNKEYSNENCVMACYWCNNAKTDEFTAKEFEPIGRAIGEALRNRKKNK